MTATSFDLSAIKTDALSAASTFRTLIGLGTLATQSPTGTPSASNFLRGDYSWQTIDLSNYLPLSGGTLTGLLTTPRITLSGNVSAAAWTTTGIGIGHVARTITDTSSSGTVATAYTNVIGGNTIAASNSTTFTDYASLQVGQPTAGSNVTFTNRWAVYLGGAIRSTGYSLTGSQAQSLVDLSGTWSTTGTPTLIKANVTDTASNAASLLMDLQVGGSSKAGITKAGKIFSDAAANLDWFSGRYAGTEYIRLGYQGSIGYGLFSGSAYSGNTGNGFGIGSTVNIVANTTWGSGTSSATFITFSHANNTSPVIKLERVGYTTKPAILIDQTTGTTSYPFEVQLNSVRKHAVASSGNVEIYNAFTNDSNYERGKLEWSSNVFRIGTEKAGTGSARALELQTDGTTRLTIGADGTITSANTLVLADTSLILQFGSNSGTQVRRASSSQNVMLRSSSITTMQGSAVSQIGATRGLLLGDVDYSNCYVSTGGFGGDIYIAPNVMGNSSRDGGNLRLFGGTASSVGNWNGGHVYIDGGALNGTGSNGGLFIGSVRTTLTTFADACNIAVGTTTGTKIGTGTTQKLGFYNATPVVQPAAVADATDAASVITQLNLLLARMRDLGLIAT
jgi:hypothetical protein